MDSEISQIIHLSSERIICLKQHFAGKSCCIIGNGPSLRIRDLELLKNTYTFGVNKIYDIYPFTFWRPTFYAVQDFKLMQVIFGEMESATLDSSYRFFNARILQIPDIPVLSGYKDFYFQLKNEWSEDKKLTSPSFSENFYACAYEGYTVTYTMLQLAVYLGFTKIYLLGVDHNYPSAGNQEMILTETFHNDYFQGYQPLRNTLLNAPQLNRSTAAYEAAKKYCCARGIQIFNATRGGNLEIFSRIPFEQAVEELHYECGK